MPCCSGARKIQTIFWTVFMAKVSEIPNLTAFASASFRITKTFVTIRSTRQGARFPMKPSWALHTRCTIINISGMAICTVSCFSLTKWMTSLGTKPSTVLAPKSVITLETSSVYFVASIGSAEFGTRHITEFTREAHRTLIALPADLVTSIMALNGTERIAVFSMGTEGTSYNIWLQISFNTKEEHKRQIYHIINFFGKLFYSLEQNL